MAKFTQNLLKNSGKKPSIYLPMIIVVVALVGLGTFSVFHSHAATPTASLEAENGVLSSRADTVGDTSAAGGQAVKFGSGSQAASCTGTNTPDGSDPWGGCFPGPDNTGVPAGTNLTVYTGTMDITQDGYVLQNTEVDGCVNVRASNVTIRNVLIKGDCVWLIRATYGGTNINVIDTELDGNDYTSNNAAVDGDNITLTRVNIHDSVDGMKLGSNEIVQDSYFHDMNSFTGPDGPTHNDCMQGLSAVGLTIHHNTCMGFNCLILSENSQSGWVMRNVDFSHNLCAGGSFAIRGGYKAGTDDPSIASNISITDNLVSTIYYPTGGEFGPLASADPPVVTHSGNIWADGPNAGQSFD